MFEKVLKSADLWTCVTLICSTLFIPRLAILFSMRFKKSSSHRKKLPFPLYPSYKHTYTHSQPHIRNHTLAHEHTNMTSDFMLANKTSSLQFSDWEWDREQEKIENALVPNPKKRERAISQTMSLITNITYMCMNECTNVHTTYFPVWLSDICCIQIFCCYSFASSFFWDYWKCKEIHPLFDVLPTLIAAWWW